MAAEPQDCLHVRVRIQGTSIEHFLCAVHFGTQCLISTDQLKDIFYIILLPDSLSSWIEDREPTTGQDPNLSYSNKIYKS